MARSMVWEFEVTAPSIAPRQRWSKLYHDVSIRLASSNGAPICVRFEDRKAARYAAQLLRTHFRGEPVVIQQNRERLYIQERDEE